MSVSSTAAAGAATADPTAAPARRGFGRLATRRPAHPTLVLALILTCQLMVVLDATIVNIALHDIRADLHFSDANLSWVINAYTLTFGGLLLLGARAGDILGRRRVFLGGITLFTIASLLGGFAQNPAELLAARAVQGIGGALASPSALALLMTMFPEARQRTRAIGYYTAVSVGGSALGLIAGGVLSEYASWRWVLYVNVPIGLALVALALPTLPETVRNRGRFDLTGAFTSTIGMGALVYAFVRAAEDGWTDTETLGSFAVGLVLMAAFVLTEVRAEAPITPLRLFADRNRSGAYLVRLLLVAGMMGMFFYLTQFLRGVLGYSDLVTGFAFVPLTVAVFTASQLGAKYLVELVGPQRLMIVGTTMSMLGMLWLTQLSADSGYGSLVGPLLIFGFGNGLAFVPLTTAALDGVDPKDAGAASGLVNVMQQVGGALGLAVLVTIFGSAVDSRTRELGARAATAGGAKQIYVYGAQHAFWLATAFVAGAWLTVLLVIRVRRPRPAAPAVVESPTDAGDGVSAREEQAREVQAPAALSTVRFAETRVPARERVDTGFDWLD